MFNTISHRAMPIRTTMRCHYKNLQELKKKTVKKIVEGCGETGAFVQYW